MAHLPQSASHVVVARMIAEANERASSPLHAILLRPPKNKTITDCTQKIGWFPNSLLSRQGKKGGHGKILG